MPADTLAVWVQTQRGIAFEEKSNFDTLIQDVARFVIPREATYTEEPTPGQERTRHIVDSTAPRSLELFASFLATTAHNPASRFFKTKVIMNNRVVETTAAKKWSEKADEAVWFHMNAGNVQSQLHKVDLELGYAGSSALMVERNEDKNAASLVKYMNAPFQNIYFFQNEDGRVDRVIRDVEWTAEQWKNKFPNGNFPAKFEQELEQQTKATGSDSKPGKWKGAHMVITNTQAMNVPGLNEDVRAARYSSIWVMLEGEATTIEQSGSDRFRYATPRWYTTGNEAYGRSPAMTVLPEIRMANKMRETLLRTKEKLADPPQLLPDGKLIGPLRLFAGGMSFTDGEVNPQSLIGNGTSTNAADQELEATRQAIREGFFVPLFATPESPVKTATQVLQESDERNRAVSPMIIRLHEELLKPMLEETFLILEDAGALPDLPPSLAEATIQIEYISPILAAQKQTEALGTMRMLESVLPVVEATQDASLLDRFDEEQMIEVLHAGSGAPAKVLADDNVFELARSERRQRESQNAQLQQALTASEVAKNLGGSQTAQQLAA